MEPSTDHPFADPERGERKLNPDRFDPERATEAALLRAALAFEHRKFNLVREGCEVEGEAIKHLALGGVGCEVADKPALGCLGA
jgi:hypothetical protein